MTNDFAIFGKGDGGAREGIRVRKEVRDYFRKCWGKVLAQHRDNPGADEKIRCALKKMEEHIDRGLAERENWRGTAFSTRSGQEGRRQEQVACLENQMGRLGVFDTDSYSQSEGGRRSSDVAMMPYGASRRNRRRSEADEDNNWRKH